MRVGTHDVDVAAWSDEGPLWQAFEKKEHRAIAMRERSFNRRHYGS